MLEGKGITRIRVTRCNSFYTALLCIIAKPRKRANLTLYLGLWLFASSLQPPAGRWQAACNGGYGILRGRRRYNEFPIQCV